MGDEDIGRFGAYKLKIGRVGVIGQPADVARCQSVACFLPGCPFIVGTKDPTFCAQQDHALPGNDAGDMLITQPAPRRNPAVAFTFTNYEPLFSCENQFVHMLSPLKYLVGYFENYTS